MYYLDTPAEFLSSNAQDFIEDRLRFQRRVKDVIPEQ